MTKILEALADKDQPGATFRALEAFVDEVIGVRLFTLLQIDHTRSGVWRAYSNIPEAYSVGDEKPLLDNDWSRQLIHRREIFVANDIDELALAFPDHALIRSLGCESCINVPIMIADKVVGTLNCLHEARHYTPTRIADTAQLTGPGAVAFLIANTFAPVVQHARSEPATRPA